MQYYTWKKKNDMALRQGEPRVLHLAVCRAKDGAEIGPLLVPVKETVYNLFRRVNDMMNCGEDLRIFLEKDLARELDPKSDWLVRQLSIAPGSSIYAGVREKHQTVCRTCRRGPISGTCYRLKGFPLDVCAKHFRALNEKLQSLFVPVPVPLKRNGELFTTAVCTGEYPSRRAWLCSVDGPYDSDVEVQRALNAGGSLAASVDEGDVVWRWPPEKVRRRIERRSTLLF